MFFYFVACYIYRFCSCGVDFQKPTHDHAIIANPTTKSQLNLQFCDKQQIVIFFCDKLFIRIIQLTTTHGKTTIVDMILQMFYN